VRLTVFGAGYVGLVTGAGLAELGHDVLIVDIDAERVRRLQDGIMPIHEPGLGDLVRRNERADRLHFATEVAAPDNADAYFIAVGTPPRPDGSANVDAVFAVMYRIMNLARDRKALVVVKSTVPVGTCDALQNNVAARNHRNALEVVSNPEFLKEGMALADFFRPDRVVLGTRSEEAAATMRALYAPLQISGECVVVCDRRSSELTKYAANAMLAMRVSMMNELSRLCHATGADIRAVRLGVGSDARIGKKFLYAGPGYGGSCFPKDVQALAHLGRQHGVTMRLAEATHTANEEQGEFLAKLVEEAVGPLAGKAIAMWGLAFKPETDDVREAPALKLARALFGKGIAKLTFHDPEARRNFEAAAAGSTPDCAAIIQTDHGQVAKGFDREYDALDGADALVLMTEWRCYLAPDFKEIARRMGGDVVVDARNVWPQAEVVRAGLRYRGIGTPEVSRDDRP